MSDEEKRKFPIEQLHEFSERVFRHVGVPAEDARVAADVLSASDSRGIDSHGIARLHRYAEFLQIGKINPRPNIRITRATPSTANMDGDTGLGLVVGPRANDLAIEKAASVGSGWVSVHNSTHYGIAGYYPMQALAHDMIGWSMTNGTSWVAPYRGTERRLSTNPLAIAFPARHEAPIVIDMATTVVAYGKIQIARRQGKPLPMGWAADRHGQPTTDPDDVDDDGSLLPLGSDQERGAHKGYCLSAMVDILTGVLSGANWGPFTPPFVTTQYNMPQQSVGKGIGHFFGCWKIDAFLDVDDFKSRMDHWIQTMHSTRPVDGTDGPMVPGEPEYLAHEDRKKNGVPLDQDVVDRLRQLAKQTGIPFQ